MQVYKTNPIRTSEVGELETPQDQTPLTDLEKGMEENAAGFLGLDTPIEADPFNGDKVDMIFAGVGKNGGPSKDQFGKENIVTLEKWIMEYPDAVKFLDKYILRMESIRDNHFARRLKNLEEAFRKGGMRPGESKAVLEKIPELKAAIKAINAEIEKAKAMQRKNNEIYEQELSLMKDINMDGVVGYFGDPERSYYVSKLPNGDEILLDPKTEKPAIDPYFNPNYEPSLFSTDNLLLLGEGEAEEHNGSSFDVALKLNHKFSDTERMGEITQARIHSHLGAQIDMAVPEFIWVEKGEDGKPKTEFKGDGNRYHPIGFTVLEDGRIGQKPPTDGERKGMVAIRVTKVVVRSENVKKQLAEVQSRGHGPNAGAVFAGGDKKTEGGDVFFELRDYQDQLIARIRVEGYELTPEQNIPGQQGVFNPEKLENGNFYVPATSGGVVLYNGEGENSARVRPVEIDASGLHSTAFQNIGRDVFLNQLNVKEGVGIGKDLNPPVSKGSVGYKADPRGDAILETLQTGFGAEIDNSNFVDGAPLGLSTGRGAEDTFGIGIIGLRGAFTGTNYNDVAMIPPPNQEEIKQLLPYGAKPIGEESPAYGTFFKGRGGKNMVVSYGGDLFAEDVTFLWREKLHGDEHRDQIWVDTTNENHRNNDKVFIHIGDQNARGIFINNGEDHDKSGNNSIETSEKDDWYEVPDLAEFSHIQNDIPGGLESDQVTDGLGPDIKSSISDAYNKITKEVINQDPLMEAPDGALPEGWEFGKSYQEWEDTAGSFFGEWGFFKEETYDGGEVKS